MWWISDWKYLCSLCEDLGFCASLRQQVCVWGALRWPEFASRTCRWSLSSVYLRSSRGGSSSEDHYCSFSVFCATLASLKSLSWDSPVKLKHSLNMLTWLTGIMWLPALCRPLLSSCKPVSFRVNVTCYVIRLLIDYPLWAVSVFSLQIIWSSSGLAQSFCLLFVVL